MIPHLPVVTGKELLRVLERSGWHVVHVRGSHHQLKHTETGQKITIPVHGKNDLKRGLLHSVLKEIGMTVEELRQLL